MPNTKVEKGFPDVEVDYRLDRNPETGTRR